MEAAAAAPQETTSEYAASIAKSSHDWYQSHAIGARRAYKLSELALIVLSAAVPVSVVVADRNTTVPALLGAALVVGAGLRSLFHWQENYLRFSQAREAVEVELRQYRLGAGPYRDADSRDEELVSAITRIEQSEMGSWLRMSATHEAGIDSSGVADRNRGGHPAQS